MVRRLDPVTPFLGTHGLVPIPLFKTSSDMYSWAPHRALGSASSSAIDLALPLVPLGMIVCTSGSRNTCTLIELIPGII